MGNHMEGELEHDIGNLGFIVVISGIGDLGYIQLESKLLKGG